jgi:hypothetical protein
MSEEFRSGRTKSGRWLTILVGCGVLLVSGTVIADVVLAYTDNNSVGTNTTSPFQFVQGSNYASANGMGFVTNAYPAGTSGPTVTTTINGVSSVPVLLFDVTEFATGKVLTTSAHVSNVNVPAPSVLTPAGVVCAYAFISTAAPSLGTTGVTGAPAGCSATMPALGSLSAGCTGGTASTVVVNLLTGVITGTIAGSCTVPTATVSGVTVLYISYAITVNAAVTATTLNAFTVPITMP